MDRKPGISKRGNIDRNVKVFHVVQRTTMKLPLFESDKVFNYWQAHLKALALEHNVVLLCYVLMSNHYHVLLYSEDIGNVQLLFRKLNTGFCQFIWTNVIKGTETERLFSEEFPYRLFSSSVRLFPVEGTVPLFIDTRYLFENPRHHGCRTFGLYYPHSNFAALLKGEFPKKDLQLFFSLYGMYPGQMMKIVMKQNPQEFREILKGMTANQDVQRQCAAFMKDSASGWLNTEENIRNTYMQFDID